MVSIHYGGSEPCPPRIGLLVRRVPILSLYPGLAASMPSDGSSITPASPGFSRIGSTITLTGTSCCTTATTYPPPRWLHEPIGCESTLPSVWLGERSLPANSLCWWGILPAGWISVSSYGIYITPQILPSRLTAACRYRYRKFEAVYMV